MMLARAVAIGAVWTAFGELQHVGQVRRAWGNMWHGQHAVEGHCIHEAGPAKTRRSVGGS